MDNGEKRELYNGFGDSLARAVEFVAVPGIFGFLGHLLDDAIGSASLFTVVFVAFALAGSFIRSYYAYEAAMRAHEANAPWRRSATPAVTAPDGGGGPASARSRGWRPASG